jgi:pimeloyl-ACP methyl ester carboxylesterase
MKPAGDYGPCLSFFPACPDSRMEHYAGIFSAWMRPMANPFFSTYRLSLLAVLALAGCMTARHEVRPPVLLAGTERGVVYCVDGAGGFQATSIPLSETIAGQRLPLRVEAVDWSHGWCRVYADQTDFAHARAQGRCLAERVAAYRRAAPAGEVYLVGHSAGCTVALAAVEALPPGYVDRVVLLSPALSADYDLRPALRSARCGVDVFSSERDWFYLGLGIGLVGTADRRWGAASGRVGFRPSPATLQDAALYAKLRQHPWNRCQAWTGNLGGHYGAQEPAFLRTFVLPLLQTSSRPPVVAVRSCLPAPR